MYAIIDIETTGGNPSRDKITEIAVFVHDGNSVIDEYHTLVNPERSIPHFISRMTGITDEMVADAPKFYEIAKAIVTITNDTTIVAHNVGFDYNFIKSEFRRLGYNYQRSTLCTVRLSRKVIPGKLSYSLGKLCNELGISIENRHRAYGDGIATVKLFETILSKNPDSLFLEINGSGSRNNFLNPAITTNLIETLPQKTGIYYFSDENNSIFYIGKSKDIRQRVISHLTESKGKKSLEMVKRIAHIDFEETGSELLALLKESEEIKKHKPLFNRQHKENLFNYGLYSYIDSSGYNCLKIGTNSNNNDPHTSFATLEKGKEFLFHLTAKFNLCQNLTGLYATSSACFQYALGICRGACCGKESPTDYNNRVEQALEYAGFTKNNLIILDKGRNENETSFIMIENGKYLGYGYIDKQVTLTEPEQFRSYLIAAEDNRDARLIITGHLRNMRTGKRITF